MKRGEDTLTEVKACNDCMHEALRRYLGVTVHIRRVGKEECEVLCEEERGRKGQMGLAI